MAIDDFEKPELKHSTFYYFQVLAGILVLCAVIFLMPFFYKSVVEIIGKSLATIGYLSTVGITFYGLYTAYLELDFKDKLKGLDESGCV